MADLDFTVREIEDAQEFEESGESVDKEEVIETSEQAVINSGDIELHNPNYIEEGDEDNEDGNVEGKETKDDVTFDNQIEEDDDEEDDDDDDVAAPPAEGSYDPSEFDHLAVDGEIKELFTFIMKYTPQTIELDHKSVRANLDSGVCSTL